jgi:hypothetical protein
MEQGHPELLDDVVKDQLTEAVITLPLVSAAPLTVAV